MRLAVSALALAAALAAAGSAAAQDMADMPGMQHPAPPAQPAQPQPPAQRAVQPPAPPPSGDPSMPGMDMSHGDQAPMGKMDMGGMHMMAGMLGSYSMMRDASGTAWQPASTPMGGMMWSSGGWSGMIHGFADIVYDHQSGPRGADQTFSESMLMVMAQHAAGPGTLTLKSMLSLDPLMGPRGYPLLLQTGETADGKTPLIDRQHPHNLFMEMAGVYSVPVAKDSSVFLYVGYPGEPALGPATFMHRYSAEDDPAAPITHHWLDSTHITFGLVTAGVVHGPWKLEASAFNGREPDQHRWDYQPFQLDSGSARLTYNPTPNWSLQASYGYLHSPEQLTPRLDQHRTTASATWNRPFKGGNWQTMLAWGRNTENGEALDAFLLESAVGFGRHTVFARAETVEKDDLFFGASPLAGRVFHVSEATLGYVYDIPVAKHVALGLGVQSSVNLVPSPLKAVYGSDDPTGVMPFLRLKVR